MLYGMSERQKRLCDQYALLVDACDCIRTVCLDSSCGIDTANDALKALHKVMRQLAFEIEDE